jgi:hypothetical protein
MNRIDHERARELMLDARIGQFSPGDSRWLASHLNACAECTRFAASLDDAVGALRMPAVTAGTSLVQATQRRVRARATEMNSQTAAMRPLWLAVVLVCATASLTTPLLWAAFAWIGAAFSLTTLEWRTGFMFAWFAPTLAASLFLIASGMNRARFRIAAARPAEAS